MMGWRRQASDSFLFLSIKVSADQSGGENRDETATRADKATNKPVTFVCSTCVDALFMEMRARPAAFV